MTKTYDQATADAVVKAYLDEGFSKARIALIHNLSASTVSRIIGKAAQQDPQAFATKEVVKESIKLAKQRQRFMDQSRIERKTFREHARADVMLVELADALNTRLETFNLAHLSQGTVKPNPNAPVGVIQLSDLHFGELVTDLVTNKFDFDVAARRLRKFAARAITTFNAQGVTNILLAMTGDLINSSRRISEITEFAAARTNVVVIAMDILQQFILELHNAGFNLSVACVVGNESRTAEYFDTTDFLASDNYDLMLHNLLKRMFTGFEGIRFLEVTNPMECVVDVNGVNFLLIHGNVHRGAATDSAIETATEKLKARYSQMGVKVDYVICGHIHKSYISNWYARSASLVGGNQYSERSLNLVSKASQNIFLVAASGEIDGMMVDLQRYQDYEPYSYDQSLVRYFPTRESRATYTIQSVLI